MLYLIEAIVISKKPMFFYSQRKKTFSYSIGINAYYNYLLAKMYILMLAFYVYFNKIPRFLISVEYFN